MYICFWFKHKEINKIQIIILVNCVLLPSYLDFNLGRLAD